MVDLIGQSLGRYHILEQLGEGGMATVYKARDTRLETAVAVKVIRTDNILPSVLDRALKRAEREAKALARLSHPNIVKVTDYGEYEGKPYLVMPYLPGGTLKQRMGKPIPWQEALQILLPIVAALDYAHSQNIVHRDVKPSNILLTEQSRPMLTDFGIAKVLDLEETMDLTGTSAAVGTPEYMAPEQVTAKTVDHRADIYALGIVLYEMVTGRKPFTADTPLAVLFKHASNPLPRAKQFAPNLPDAVEKLLLVALAKNPADRYQNMSEMETSLKKIIDRHTKKSAPRKKSAFPAIQIVAGKRALINSVQSLKSASFNAATFIRNVGAIGIVFVLFLVSLGIMPQFFSSVSLTRIDPTGIATIFPAVQAEILSSPTVALTVDPTDEPISVVPGQTMQGTASALQNTSSSSGSMNKFTLVATLSYRDYSWWKDPIEWSPDSSLIAFADSEGESHTYKVSLYIYDVKTDDIIKLIDGVPYPGTVSNIAFNAGQNYIAAGIRDFNEADGRMVILWRKASESEWEEYEKIDLVAGYGEASVRFSEFQDTMAHGIYGGVGIWDLQEKKLIRSFSGLGQNDYGENVFFLDNERYIGYSGFRTVFIRRVEDGSLIANLPGRILGIFPRQNEIVGLKPDGEGGQALYIYEVNSGAEYIIAASLPEYASEAFSLSEDGAILGFSDWNAGKINVYNLTTREVIFSQSSRGQAMVFPDGSAVTIYDSGRDVSEIFDLASSEIIGLIGGQVISISPNNAYLITQSTDGVKIWSFLQE